MTRLNIIACLLFSFNGSNFAQSFIANEYGNISPKEIELKTCSFDPTADAIVLFDLGESKFIRTKNGYDIKFSRHKRIKILKASGRDHAEISIPFYIGESSQKQKVKSLLASTYNEIDGAVLTQAIDPNQVYEEKINQYWAQKKFVFPNVQEGSMLEYSYDLIIPNINGLPDWEFQSDIPTLYSQYKVYMVPFYEYVNLLQGVDSLDVRSVEQGNRRYNDFGFDYKHNIYTVALRNIEAFEDESFITSKSDYIKKIDFQLSKIYYTDGRQEEFITTWKSLREELLDHYDFGRYLKGCKRLAKNILKEEVDTTGLTPTDKAKRLIEYVKKSFNWNGYRSKWSSQSPKDFLQSRSGNTADINLFLIALLNEAGIHAEPMLISTRDHGKIKHIYPFEEAINNIIVYVQTNRPFLTDGTTILLDYNMIPKNSINDIGLLVNKEEEDRWMSIEYSMPSTDDISIAIEIAPEKLEAKFTIRSKSDFFQGFDCRNNFRDNQKTLEEYFSSNLDVIDSISTKNYDIPSAPYLLSVNGSKEIDKLGDFLIIRPFLNLAYTKNPLTLEKRTYPVDFIYPYKNKYRISIPIPKGYLPTDLPEDVLIENELVSIHSKWIYNEAFNHLQNISHYHFKRAIYQPEAYLNLKKNLAKIVETFNVALYFEKEI
ncbi:MAG: transglutaminase domain-containing protein [Bacteroidota bacterium]